MTRESRKKEEDAAADKELHKGHRGRLKARFLREGEDSFDDHQVLELLLFYAVPRLDTNPSAHRLMQRFGSFSAVLEADPKDLSSVEGVGANAAAFLAMIPQITRRYFLRQGQTYSQDPQYLRGCRRLSCASHGRPAGGSVLFDLP